MNDVQINGDAGNWCYQRALFSGVVASATTGGG
jgi:hypothetical protein